MFTHVNPELHYTVKIRGTPFTAHLTPQLDGRWLATLGANLLGMCILGTEHVLNFINSTLAAGHLVTTRDPDTGREMKFSNSVIVPQMILPLLPVSDCNPSANE